MPTFSHGFVTGGFKKSTKTKDDRNCTPRYKSEKLLNKSGFGAGTKNTDCHKGLQSNANMLVMDTHHHTGVMDYLYGEMVDKVRQQLTIPVLIVN